MCNIRMALCAMTLLFAPILILQGCAAPMIVAGATTGVAGYQTMQLSQESDVNIRFSNDAGAMGTPLQSVKTIGVWPSIPEMTTLAEKLQSTNAFRRVITPYKINQSLRAMGVQSIDPAMTAYEKQRLFKKVASRTGADGIIYVTPKGESSDTRMLGFARPEYAMHYQIDVYSPMSDSTIWSEMLDVVIAVGATTPSNNVIVGAAVDAVVNRMQVLAGKAPLTTGNNAVAQATDHSMSCRDIRAEISVLNRQIQNQYGQQANATMQQYPPSAGDQLATRAATDAAARTAPGAIPYIQPLMASAKDMLDKFKSSGKEDELAKMQARRDHLASLEGQKCHARAKGDPVTKEIQALLNKMGYPCGVADGIAGGKTDSAIRRYQSDRGLLVDGRASPELLAMMKKEMAGYE